MNVSIMQPAFLPWLGYFNRIVHSDLHIVLDHVQIDKSSKTNFANRNKIRTREGWIWLTVPIVRRGQTGNLALNRIRIAEDTDWIRKTWASIQHNYAGAKHFKRYSAPFEATFHQAWTHLADLNARLTEDFLRSFEIKVKTRLSSEMNVEGDKDDLILNLVKSAGATRYISGPFGRGYLDLDKFARAGIEVVFHDYAHPHYAQAFPGFEPCMSAIDLLFNCGPDSRKILCETQEFRTS